MYDLTYFKGDKTQTIPTEDFGGSWADVVNSLNKCQKGVKNSSYFVRGKCVKSRLDINIDHSNVLVIDGDDSSREGEKLCSPKELHEVLKELGYKHVIHTTHSHSEEVNKFRCVVASQEYKKEQSRAQIAGILRMLEDEGIHIKYVKEMNTFSQPWFMPTRDDPDDGLFRSYQSIEGRDWELVESKEVKGEAVGNTYGDQETCDEIVGNILKGENVHPSLNNVITQLSGNPSKKMISSVMHGLMSNSEIVGTPRWAERENEINRSIDGAWEKREEDEQAEKLVKVEVAKSQYNGEIPRAPGLLGELEQTCYDSLLYQSREISLVSTLGLIAGICGRKFNVPKQRRMGLNLYLTIVADTGVGKEGISTFINDVIRLAMINNCEKPDVKYTSFIGPSSFTSGKAIYGATFSSRSIICVMTEAGIMLKVKSGDVETKTATLLSNFDASGSTSFTKGAAYSKAEDNVVPLQAVAMTIISESTPDHLMEAYSNSNAIHSGYLPRQMIFRCPPRRKVINRQAKPIEELLSDKVKNRLWELIDLCSQVQGSDDPSAIDIGWSKDTYVDMLDYQDKYNLLEYEWKGVDQVRQNMATRAGVKAIRVAGIITIFNNYEKDKELTIGREEWEYAKKLVDKEYERVNESLGGLGGNNDLDSAVMVVYNKMESILNDTIGNKDCKVDKRFRDKGIVPMHKLRIATKGNMVIDKVKVDSSYKKISGLDIVIAEIERNKGVEKLYNDPISGKKKIVLRVLPGLESYITPLRVC